MRLRELQHPHERVSLSSVFVRENHSIFLSDPWLFPRDETASLDLNKNGHSYPSPQKIHYQNNLGDAYDPYLSDYYSLGLLILQLIHMEDMTFIYSKGYRRIYEQAIVKLIGKVGSEEVRNKLKILLDFYPNQRRMIQDMCREEIFEKSQVRPVLTSSLPFVKEDRIR